MRMQDCRTRKISFIGIVQDSAATMFNRRVAGQAIPAVGRACIGAAQTFIAGM